jgi:hypothetical protein
MEKLPSGRRRTEFQAEWWPDGASRWRRMKRRWRGRSVARERERERRIGKERREEEERVAR